MVAGNTPAPAPEFVGGADGAGAARAVSVMGGARAGGKPRAAMPPTGASLRVRWRGGAAPRAVG
eukprot:scaffold39202_cov55-Phaeocystis_antarctica.AAC.3